MKITAILLLFTASVLASCSSTDPNPNVVSSTLPHYLPNPNGKGGLIEVPAR